MSKRIVNVGICTVDAIGQYVEDYPPRKGLIFFDKLTLATGGNAVNCSIALRKLGLECDAVVKVGRDIFGDYVVRELEQHGVGTRGVIRGHDAGTPFTFVAAHRDGERSFIHMPGTNATLRFEEIDLKLIEQADFLFLTGSMVMAALDGAPSARLLEWAKRSGATTLLDTVYASTVPATVWREKLHPCLPFVDFFVPSLPEARRLAAAAEVEAMAAEFAALGGRNVVIKLDSDGAFCRDESGKCQHVSAYDVPKVVDATGAGDTWCAGFIAGLVDGLDLPDAVRFGHAVAAHAIQAIGASTGVPSRATIREFQRRAGR